MAELGFRTMEEMTGRSDMLKMKDHQITRRAEMVRLDQMIHSEYTQVKTRHYVKEKAYDFHLEKTIDERIFLPKLNRWNIRKPLQIKDVAISSTDRAVGTILGSVMTEKYGTSLPDDTIVITLHGGGGQSFGAFIPNGLTLKLKGDANDGFGKGLSGGKLVITPPEKAAYPAEENTIIGNVALYGATSGTAYINGIAGERFMVRNSGALAVCEGCGDHGLEYMTGGKAVILGDVGKNFAAGMSGGIAYVLDEKHTLYTKTNKSLINITEVREEADKEELWQILTDYVRHTGSQKAEKILSEYDHYAGYFKKIIPADYMNMLVLISKYEKQGIGHTKAVYEAFKEATSGSE